METDVAVVKLQMKKTLLEEGLRGVRRSMCPKNFLAPTLNVSPVSPHCHATTDEEQGGEHKDAECGLAHVSPPE
ncbi:hypothetical protein EMIT047CA2_80055 [Pseudomonas soli]